MPILVLAAIMWSAITIGPAAAEKVTLTPLPVPWQSYIGIDWNELLGELVVSRNYVTPPAIELGIVLATIPPTGGTPEAFSTLTGTVDELKVATARSSPDCQQFPVGTVFTANGNPGEIVRINPDGTLATHISGSGPGAWIALPGETDFLRGSFFVDRFCDVFGGDLIAVTGNGRLADFEGPELGIGDVWRVKADGTATLVARVGVHLEGVITLPDDPKTYGPWAGKIIAGAENVNINLLPGHPGNPGTVYAIGADGSVTPFSLTDQFGNSVKPEDIDIIEEKAPFFGVAFQDQQILTAPASAFDHGDILITQEFPYPETTGLNLVRWNAKKSEFDVTVLIPEKDQLETCPPELTPGVLPRRAYPCQWEHVTFAPGACRPSDVKKTKENEFLPKCKGKGSWFDAPRSSSLG